MSRLSQREEDGSHTSDGCNRWFILVGLFMMSFLEIGSTRTLSLFLDDLTFQFDVTTSYMGAVYGFIIGTPYCLALISVPLLRFFSVRQLVTVGGVLSSSGMIAASFTSTTLQITIALVTYGIGFIFIALPLNSCPATYFPHRFEIATGVFISGGSVGVMMMPLVFETLKELYGWRGGILLLGALNIHLIVIGLLLKPVKKQFPRHSKDPGDHDEARSTLTISVEPNHLKGSAVADDPNIPMDTDLITNEGELSTQAFKTPDSQIYPEVKSRWENKGFGERDANITDQPTLNDIEVSDRPIAATSSVSTFGTNSSPTPGRVDESAPASNNFTENGGTGSQIISTFNLLMSFVRFFKDHPIMIIVCIEVYTYSLSFGTWLLFTIPNAQAKGLSDLDASQLSIAGGIANFLGRFASGFITSRNWAPIGLWLMIANCISAVAFFMNYVANSFWFLVTLSLIFGFTFGIKVSTLFSLVMYVVGEKNYKTGLGVIFLSAGIAYLIFGSFVGAIYDYTQSYNIAFCIMGAVDVFGAILIITPLVWTRLCRKFVT